MPINSCCCSSVANKFCWIRWQWNCATETAILAFGTNAGCDTDSEALPWNTWTWVDDNNLNYLQKGPACVSGGSECDAFWADPAAPDDPSSEIIDLHCPFFRRARYCSDGTYTNLYMPTTLTGSYTGAFTVDVDGYTGQCLYFDLGESPQHTHPGDLILSGPNIVQTFADCPTCLGRAPCGDCHFYHIQIYDSGDMLVYDAYGWDHDNGDCAWTIDINGVALHYSSGDGGWTFTVGIFGTFLLPDIYPGFAPPPGTTASNIDGYYAVFIGCESPP